MNLEKGLILLVVSTVAILLGAIRISEYLHSSNNTNQQPRQVYQTPPTQKQASASSPLVSSPEALPIPPEQSSSSGVPSQGTSPLSYP